MAITDEDALESADAAGASGNKHTRRRLETRANLLRAARGLINEGRFRSASTEEISALAGVSRAGFYLHFASKEEILGVLQTEVGEWYRRQIRKLDANTAATKDSLVGWLREYRRGLDVSKHVVSMLVAREDGNSWIRDLGAQLRGEAVLMLATQVPAFRLLNPDGRINDERRLRTLLLIFQIEQLCQYLALIAPDEGDLPLEILADEILRFART